MALSLSLERARGAGSSTATLKTFQRAGELYDAEKKRHRAEQEANKRANVAEQRRKELERMEDSKKFNAAWEDNATQQHAKNIAIRQEREQRDRTFKAEQTEKRAQSKRRETAAAEREMQSTIAVFEENIKRQGVGEKELKAIDEQLHDPTSLLQWSLKSGVAPVEHMRSLAANVATDEQASKQMKAYLTSIKGKKAEEAHALKEREKRRRKVLVEQAKAHEEMEEKRIEQVLLERMYRQTNEEQRITAQLMETRREKEVIFQQRLYREKQYRERRDRDYDAQRERENILAREERDEYEEKVAFEKQRHDDIYRQRKAEAYQRDYEDCHEVVDALVDLTLRICDYRTMSELRLPDQPMERPADYSPLKEPRLVPPQTMREWVAIFISGLPQFESTKRKPALNPALESIVSISSYADGDSTSRRDTADNTATDLGGDMTAMTAEGTTVEKTGDEEVVSVASEGAVLDDIDLTDYLQAANQWMWTGAPDRPNYVVGDVVKFLLEYTAPPPTPPELPNLPPFPVKLGLVGRSFAGKTSLAEALARKYYLAILTPENVVTEALAFLGTEEGKAYLAEHPPEPSTPRKHKKPPVKKPPHKKDEPIPEPTLPEMAVAAEQALQEGRDVDDDLLVQLFVYFIKQTEADTVNSGGWVIDGFPKTPHQAQLLEKAISGFEPKKERGASAKSKKDAKDKPQMKQQMKKASKKGSRITPPSPRDPPPPPVPRSGVDIMFRLDIDDELALRRALGRRVNPDSPNPPERKIPGMKQAVFHLEFDPPPIDTGITDKLLPKEDPSNNEQQVQHRLDSYSQNLKAMDKWFAQFDHLVCPLNGELTPDELVDQAVAAVEASLARKEEEKRKREAEAEAERLRLEAEAAAKAAAEEAAREEAARRAAEEDGDSDPRAGTPQGPPPSRGRPTSSAGARAATSAEPERATEPPDLAVTRQTGSKASLVGDGSAITAEAPVDDEKELDKALAEILVDQWTTIEYVYQNEIKPVFRKLREQRYASVVHLYNVRSEFFEFLRRVSPAKNDLLIGFQQNFNDFEDDLRVEADAKSELHQRVEELKEKLWEISDQRKEEAEAERGAIMRDGWLDDNLGIVTNYFITLMQLEVDRFQGTKQFIKDYYAGKRGEILDEETVKRIIIPLLELPDTEAPTAEPLELTMYQRPTSTSRDVTSSAKAGKRSKKGKSSENVSSTKEKKSDKGERGDKGDKGDKGKKSSSKTLAAKEVAQTARGKTSTKGKKDGVKDVKYDEELERAALMAVAVLDNNGEIPKHHEKGKHGKDSRDGRKKGSKKGPPSAQPKKEEPKARATSSRARGKKGHKDDKDENQPVSKLTAEQNAANELEDALLRTRIERLKILGKMVLVEIQKGAADTYEILDIALGVRFRGEMEAIGTMVDYVKEMIEQEKKLMFLIKLEDTDFVIDQRYLVLEPAPVPPAPPPTEDPSEIRFSCAQLVKLRQHMGLEAPGGLLPTDEFVLLMLRNQAHSAYGVEEFPARWMRLERRHFDDLAGALDPLRKGLIDWKEFIMLLALPRYPSITELMIIKRAYRAFDPEGTNRLPRNDFLSVPLYFEEERMRPAWDDEIARIANGEEEAWTEERVGGGVGAHGSPTAGMLALRLDRLDDGDVTDRSLAIDAPLSDDEDTGFAAYHTSPYQPPPREPPPIRPPTERTPRPQFTGQPPTSAPSRFPQTKMTLPPGSPRVWPNDNPGSRPSTALTASSAAMVIIPPDVEVEVPVFDRPVKLRELFAHMFAFGAGAEEVTYTDFLQYLCRDVNGFVGLRKAFAVLSTQNDGRVSIQQLQRILCHSLRQNQPPPLDDPFARKVLQGVFQSLGIAPSDTVSFEELSRSTLAPHLEAVAPLYMRKTTYRLFKEPVPVVDLAPETSTTELPTVDGAVKEEDVAIELENRGMPRVASQRDVSVKKDKDKKKHKEKSKDKKRKTDSADGKAKKSKSQAKT